MKRIVGGFIIGLFSLQISYSQDVTIELGPGEVALNQMWTLSITIQNERLKNYTPFPEISGLVKRGTSSSTSTSYVNGRMTSSQSMIQNYQPVNEGKVTIPDFTIAVNGKNYNVKGKTITITAPVQRRAVDPFDPFQDLFNQRREPTEFVDIEADAFLALTTDKNEVFLGEGFTTTLAFYVAESNRADMRFHDLGNQITEIVKLIKPESSWEENFNIDNINGEPVVIKDKRYTQYKIFQASYFPLNEDPIYFPSVGLKLIKYKQAKNPSFFGRSRQEDFETFNSKAKTVTVKPLPPHPLMDKVVVGNFRLQEKISSQTLQTGQSFNYTFNVAGEGNISAIEAPSIPDNDEFDFYAPNVQQNVRRASNVVNGTKSFDYYGIPNEPGSYDLGNLMFWVYFDPLKEEYDTLRSDIVVNVTGESRKNEHISSNDLGTFYDGIAFENNTLRSIIPGSLLQIFSNVFILAVLAISGVLIFKK